MSTAISSSVLSGSGGVPPSFVYYDTAQCSIFTVAGTIADASTSSTGGMGGAFVTFNDLTFSAVNDIVPNYSQNELGYLAGQAKIEIVNDTGDTSYGISSVYEHDPVVSGICPTLIAAP